MPNLLKTTVDPYEVNKTLVFDGNEKFKYSVSEGGYISNDGAVILYTDRKPYGGMLIPAKLDVPEEVLKKWVFYVSELFHISDRKGREQEYDEAFD